MKVDVNVTDMKTTSNLFSGCLQLDIFLFQLTVLFASVLEENERCDFNVENAYTVTVIPQPFFFPSVEDKRSYHS
jgi:hypothetical protein